MELLQIVLLLAATITMGLMAGVFMIFSVAIMPGLARTDDRTYIGAFQAIDRAILNPLFLSTFLGALALPALAALAHLPDGSRAALPWIVAAFVLYLAVVVITGRLNVPLNNEIKAAGPPEKIADPAAVRSRFERRWVRWNVVRTVLTVLAFGLLAWTLIAHT
jgi:uncharacterized membrane protein